MSEDYCARPGCGAPKAWHTTKSTVADLGVGFLHHYAATPNRVEPSCLGNGCLCTSYLAPAPPEPPEPERKPYVVEAGLADLNYWGAGVYTIDRIPAIPLDEYLAAHPQPHAFPANTKCAVRGCDYYTATVLCTHCAASLANFTKQQLMNGPQS